MKEKRLENARICPKGDIEANWNKAIGFVPKDKEIIIYKADAAHPVARFKIGDGVTAVQDLNFSGADMTAIEQLVNEKGELLIEYVDNAVDTIIQELDNKLDKSGGTVGGDLSIQGDLNVTGTTTTKDTETILVKDNVIVANSDGNELLEEAGFAVKTGAAAAYGIMYDPVGDGVKIGLGTFDENGKFEYTEGEDQFLATRNDEIADGNLVKWDDTKKKLVDAGNEYVKKTDKPAYGKVGVVVGQFDRMGEGIDYSESYGYYLYSATNDFIAKRGQDTLRPGAITCLNLDDALKIGVTGYRKEDDGSETLGNQLPLTTEEQQAALSWLGAVGLDYKATQTTLGLVKGTYYNRQGVAVSQDGQLSIVWAGEDIIQGRYNANYTQGWYKPIVPKTIDKAVKWVLTGYGFKDGEDLSNLAYGKHEPMTEEEQGKACEWLGAVKKDTSKATNKSALARVYGIDNDGNQVILDCVSENSRSLGTKPNTIAMRDGDGNFEVALLPYFDNHAVSKRYAEYYMPDHMGETNRARWREFLNLYTKDEVDSLPDHLTLTENSTDEEGNQVEGTRAKWLNWLGAVQAQPDNKRIVKAYCVGTDGKQVMYNVGTSIAGAIPYTIALYLGEAQGDIEAGFGWLVSKTPTKPYHTATKKYVDDNNISIYEISNVTIQIQTRQISQNFKIIVPKKNSINIDDYTDPSVGNYHTVALSALFEKNNNTFEMVIGGANLSYTETSGQTTYNSAAINKVTLENNIIIIHLASGEQKSLMDSAVTLKQLI